MKLRLLGIFLLINILIMPLAYAEEGPTVEFFSPLLWMGCDSNNGNLVSSRTVIPEDPIGGRCFLLDIGFKHFLSMWPL